MECSVDYKPRLYIIRGLPGSGKTTLAQQLSDTKERGGWVNYKAAHFEADMYFTNDKGEYKFDGSKIKDAHGWCLEQVRNALENGRDVVVSNTFTQRWELEPYLQAARDYDADVMEIVCKGQFQNVHGVPNHIIERMKFRWED